MRLYLRSDGSQPHRATDTISACSLDLSRHSGGGAGRLEKRARAGSGGSRLEDDRFSVGDTRSVDSLESGDVVSLLDTPSSSAPVKPWVVGKSGGLMLDLSHLQAYEGGDSSSQTPGSTPSPLETSKPFPGDREATSSLTEDSFLFSDNISLGESFNTAEVRRLLSTVIISFMSSFTPALIQQKYL